MTIAQTADRLQATYWDVYRVVRFLELQLPPCRGRKIPPEKAKRINELLTRTNKSPSDIQRELGLASRSTIYRARDKMRRRAERKAGAFQPIRSQKPKRCPVHGLVHVWPCVACMAQGVHHIELKPTRPSSASATSPNRLPVTSARKPQEPRDRDLDRGRFYRWSQRTLFD